jgi:hypothetical protein
MARSTSWTWQERHPGCGKTNVLDVARNTSGTWQDRHLGHGKRDVWDVARATSWRWQERRLRGGKRDGLEVARVTSWRWQERRMGCGKSDIKRYQLRRGCYGRDTPRRRNSDCVVGILKKNRISILRGLVH